MWQFAEATRGLADGCLQLGIPVTGGNVSFYNQTGETAINPTPVVGVLGVIDDVARRTPIAWGPAGDLIYVLGDTRDEFGGSEWAHHVHGHLGGLPPAVDLERERTLGEVLVAGSRDGMLTAAHDVSDGGIAQVLVEMALGSNAGGRCSVPGNVDPFTFLFSESAGRAVVVVPAELEGSFLDLCTARGLPAARIGEVDGGEELEFANLFSVALGELREAHEGTLPRLFG
jgi:phosphoribosylformylglycinamidine synthase